MYSFINDYSEGAHPSILAKLTSTNFEQSVGYGFDKHCQAARKLIQTACGNKNLDIHFLVGGTQTNLTFISSVLRPHEGVFGVVSSHINTHEAGAIERTGHKVIPIPSEDGKLTRATLGKAFLAYKNDPNRLHWVKPKMVYISQPTELGTLYTKKELTSLYAYCKKQGLYLYIDGARLGYALATPKNDVTLPVLAKACDAFYIGGTKCGALLGEALVLVNKDLKEDFFTLMKQAGAVMAKGRVVGIQFEELFTANTYETICANGIVAAQKISNALKAKGYKFLAKPETNQLFPILPNAVYNKLSKFFVLDLCGPVDKKHTAVRICTSWCTKPEEVDKLVKLLENGKSPK